MFASEIGCLFDFFEIEFGCGFALCVDFAMKLFSKYIVSSFVTFYIQLITQNTFKCPNNLQFSLNPKVILNSSYSLNNSSFTSLGLLGSLTPPIQITSNLYF